MAVAAAAAAVVAEGGAAAEAEAASRLQLLRHAVRIAERLERGAKEGGG